MPKNCQRLRLACGTSLADQFIRSARSVLTLDGLQSLMESVTADMGFKHYALIHHTDLRNSPIGRVDLRRYPVAAVDRIINQVQYRRDPVIRACLFAESAFTWSELPRIIKLDRRDREILESGRRIGLNEGITVPCVLLGDCLGSCTFAGTRWPAKAAHFLGSAQMIGIFAFQAARRLVKCERPPADWPSLHPRPRECIILVGRGMSNKEIALTLGITPRTVDGYLTEARTIFGVHDRTSLVFQAVLSGAVGLEELKTRWPT